MSKWTHPMPIWVSRKDSSGLIADATVPMWLFMVILLLCLVNALGWLAFGVYSLWHVWSGVL